MANSLPIATKPVEECAQSEGSCDNSSDDSGWSWLEAILAGVCGVATLVSWLLPMFVVASASEVNWPAIVALAIAYIAGGFAPFVGGVRQLLKLQIGVDLLMIIAALGTAAIGEALEGAILLFLFSLSHVLEHYAMDSARCAIDALVELRPAEASVLYEGVEKRVPIELLKLGDLVRIRPGERIAVDGVVAEGETWIDESTLTGESSPVGKKRGDAVFAGTLNGAGSIVAKTTALAADTTLERIIALVREAQSTQPPVQQFVERWQGTYVLSVLGLALIVFLATWFFHSPDDMHDAFYHAMVLLVAASPCAVVASVPAIMLSAIARGARGGMLCKGGVHLEALGAVDTIAIDKTGTLTTGQLTVTEIWTPQGISADRLLAIAAAVEMSSEHPLAAAVVRAAQSRELSTLLATDFKTHTGHGVSARVEGRIIAVGREPLLVALGIHLSTEAVASIARMRSEGATVVIVAESRSGSPRAPDSGDPIVGAIAVTDAIRPNVQEALEQLHKLGVGRIIVLTGDHQQAAERVAKAVAADEVQAGLMPGEKLAIIRRLRDDGATVAMVGDGVNDAPALAAASVGIAMGGRGTDVALETADVVLMRDDLLGLPFAIWLGRRAVSGMRQNLILSLTVVALLVVASIVGLPLWLSVLCHEGSTLLVVINGVRILTESPSRTSYGCS